MSDSPDSKSPRKRRIIRYFYILLQIIGLAVIVTVVVTYLWFHRSRELVVNAPYDELASGLYLKSKTSLPSRVFVLVFSPDDKFLYVACDGSLFKYDLRLDYGISAEVDMPDRILQMFPSADGKRLCLLKQTNQPKRFSLALHRTSDLVKLQSVDIKVASGNTNSLDIVNLAVHPATEGWITQEWDPQTNSTAFVIRDPDTLEPTGAKESEFAFDDIYIPYRSPANTHSSGPFIHHKSTLPDGKEGEGAADYYSLKRNHIARVQIGRVFGPFVDNRFPFSLTVWENRHTGWSVLGSIGPRQQIDVAAVSSDGDFVAIGTLNLPDEEESHHLMIFHVTRNLKIFSTKEDIYQTIPKDQPFHRE